MLNVAIVDDENVQTDLLFSLVNKWAIRNSIKVIINTFQDAESFLFSWYDNKSFDVLLLDIQMSGMNGIDLAKNIRKSDDNLSIIFITGLSDYISDGYDVSALHYLLKPVQEDKLFACMDKACIKAKKDQPSIIVNVNGEVVRILEDELIFVEAFAHTIFLQSTKNSYEVKMSISSLEKSLNPTKFVRCHRSYIVGIRYVSKICKTDLTLDNSIKFAKIIF